MLRNIEPGPKYPEEKTITFLNRYNDMFGTYHQEKRNPCSQPMSLERKDIKTLFEKEYVVADKSDGVRYNLYLDQVKDKKYSFLVNRKLDFYQIPIAATKSFFAGSLFDGELVWIKTKHNTKTQLYLVFDVIAYMGSTEIQKMSYFKRLELIRKIFDLEGQKIESPECAIKIAKLGKLICGGNEFGLSLKPKPCYPMSQLDCLLRLINNLQYDTDGIIFTPVNAPVETGTSKQIFKLKRKHTIDLEVNNDILYAGIGGNSKNRCPLDSCGISYKVSPLFWPQLTAALSISTPTHIVECELLKIENECIQLSFEGLRHDKIHPNTVQTILATIKNVRENIRPEELVDEIRRRPIDEENTNSSILPLAAGCIITRHGGASLANVAVNDAVHGKGSWL